MECEDEGIDTYLFFAALSMATLLVEIVKQEE